MVQGFKRRLFIQVGIALALIVLFTIFIVLLNSDINKRELSIEVSKEKLALRNQTIRLLSSSNDDLKKAQPLLANLKSILPNHDQLFTFKDEIAQTAKGYGVSIGIDFPKGGEQPGSETQPGSVKFEMTLSGSYENLVSFLKAFEMHRYFMQIDGIEIIIGKTADEFFLKTSGGKIFIK